MIVGETGGEHFGEEKLVGRGGGGRIKWPVMAAFESPHFVSGGHSLRRREKLPSIASVPPLVSSMSGIKRAQRTHLRCPHPTATSAPPVHRRRIISRPDWSVLLRNSGPHQAPISLSLSLQLLAGSVFISLRGSNILLGWEIFREPTTEGRF